VRIQEIKTRSIEGNFRALIPICGNARRKASNLRRTRSQGGVFPRERARTYKSARKAYPRRAVPYRERVIGAIIGIEKGALETSGGLQSARPAMTGPDPGSVVAPGHVSTRGLRASPQRRPSNNADSSGDDCIAISHRRYFCSPNSRSARGADEGAEERESNATLRVGMFRLRRMPPVRALLADCRAFRGSIGLR